MSEIILVQKIKCTCIAFKAVFNLRCSKGLQDLFNRNSLSRKKIPSCYYHAFPQTNLKAFSLLPAQYVKTFFMEQKEIMYYYAFFR